MLDADVATVEECTPRWHGAPSGGAQAVARSAESRELSDLLQLVREDVQLGAAGLASTMEQLARSMASLRTLAATLEDAAHTLAAHEAARASTGQKLAVLRRLMAHRMSEAAAQLDGPLAASIAEIATVLDQGLLDLGEAVACEPVAIEALERLVGGATRLHAQAGDLALGLQAADSALDRFQARLRLSLTPSTGRDRRKDPRLPVRMAATLACGDRSWQGMTVDLARGGALVALETTFERPPIGGFARLELAELGWFPARIVGLSARGVHLAFADPEPDRQAVLEGRLAALQAQDAPFVNLALWAAREVEAAFARGVAADEVTLEALFTSAHAGLQKALGKPASDLAAAALATFLAARLGPLQEKIAQARPEIVHAACVDRHGYLPLAAAGPAADRQGAAASPLLGLAGRPDESAAGLSAARNRQPHLVHEPAPGIREVTVPITVQGRHWGAFRLGFRAPCEGRRPEP